VPVKSSYLYHKMHRKMQHQHYCATKYCHCLKCEANNEQLSLSRCFPWHFHDSCQTPTHFQILQPSGHPVCSEGNFSKDEKTCN